MIALAVAIGAPSIIAIWESPSYFYLYGLNQILISTPVRFGALVAILITVLWTAFAIGRAYELSGVPKLDVANELDEDHDVFRLRLLSEQKDFETTVRLMEVFNADGSRCLPGRFPISLDWTHHSGESKVHLTKGVSESVSVARINRSETGQVGMLFYTGATHSGPIQISIGKSAYFYLRIDHATRKPIERWFRFEQIDNAEIKAFANALPRELLKLGSVH